MTTLNATDATATAVAVAKARADPARVERHPYLVAEWTGSDRSRVRIPDGTLEVNGL